MNDYQLSLILKKTKSLRWSYLTNNINWAHCFLIIKIKYTALLGKIYCRKLEWLNLPVHMILLFDYSDIYFCCLGNNNDENNIKNYD